MSAEPADFAEFRALSAALGNNPLLVQGAGGNISIKHNGAMWVKASGAWLRDATAKNIFVTVDYKGAEAGMAEPVYRRLDNNTALRPSIETSLHAALPHRVIAHIHAVEVIALTVQSDCMNQLSAKLSTFRFCCMPYIKPGWPLTQALSNSIMSPPEDIYILRNHGLIVCGNTAPKLQALLTEIEKHLKTSPRPAPRADIAFLEKATQGLWRLPKNPVIHGLATDTASLKHATGGTLYPDHVVFLGRGCHAVADYQLADIDPAQHRMILIKGKGVLLAADLSPAGEEMALALAEIVARIPAGANLHYLSAKQEDELLNWDAEKYRQGAV